MFAKLYETEYGQILVKLDVDGEDKPEIRIYYKPDNHGVCSAAYQYDDWETAEDLFQKINEETALATVKNMYNLLADNRLE